MLKLYINEETITKDVILNILLRSNNAPQVLEEENVTYLPLRYAPCAEPDAYNILLSGVSA